ncbi:pentapeptide repeat-containing protein [Methanosarcina mazei]|uniref:Pentapeptide repeat-containing protein n=1 Tax=Methanosarcina mazei TaxID=2209 RepID=A0A6C0VG07_METMZ|nr:pentapeptide repeat-containing protein [Methanosarcina mazei]
MVIIFGYILLQVPHRQVAQFGINNTTDKAKLENDYRATLTQIIGGFVILFGLFFTWRNLVTIKEGQITERFTKAVDQLGATDQTGQPAIEIRLGGIYALGRIAKESKEDYWPIMEILTAYIRKNSSIDNQRDRKEEIISLDIQAILTIIGENKYSYKKRDLHRLNLERTNLKGATLGWANLEKVHFKEANLKEAYFFEAILKEAHLEKTDLEGANLKGANLKGAKNLTVDQLSKAKTLYKAKLDPELEKPLREKCPALFEKPDE